MTALWAVLLVLCCTQIVTLFAMSMQHRAQSIRLGALRGELEVERIYREGLTRDLASLRETARRSDELLGQSIDSVVSHLDQQSKARVKALDEIGQLLEASRPRVTVKRG